MTSELAQVSSTGIISELVETSLRATQVASTCDIHVHVCIYSAFGLAGNDHVQTLLCTRDCGTPATMIDIVAVTTARAECHYANTDNFTREMSSFKDQWISSNKSNVCDVCGM